MRQEQFEKILARITEVQSTFFGSVDTRLNETSIFKMSVEQFKAFGEALAQRESLQTIDLSYNYLLSQMTADQIQAFGEALAQCKSLKTINLSHNSLFEMNADQIQAFGEALAQCNSLKTIDLGGNKLGTMDQEKFPAFGEALAKCESLQTIYFYGNCLCDMSAEQFQAFGKALAQCESLQTIDLGGNMLREMSAEHFQAFGKALAQCKSLQTIGLSSNYLYLMDPEQFQALGEALAQSKSLQSIGLEFNGLNETRAGLLQAFGEALAQSNSLDSIDLTYNGITVLNLGNNLANTILARRLLRHVSANIENKSFLFRENLLPEEYSSSEELSKQLVDRLRMDDSPLASLTLALLLSCGGNTACIQGLHANATNWYEALDCFEESVKEPAYLPMVQTVLYFMHGFVENIINKPVNYHIDDVENLKSFFYELNELCEKVDAKASLVSSYLDFKKPRYGFYNAINWNHNAVYSFAGDARALVWAPGRLLTDNTPIKPEKNPFQLALRPKI